MKFMVCGLYLSETATNETIKALKVFSISPGKTRLFLILSSEVFGCVVAVITANQIHLVWADLDTAKHNSHYEH